MEPLGQVKKQKKKGSNKNGLSRKSLNSCFAVAAVVDAKRFLSFSFSYRTYVNGIRN